MTSSGGFSLHKECVKLKKTFILHSFLRLANYTNFLRKTIGFKIAKSTMPRDVQRNSITIAMTLVCVLTFHDPKVSFSWPLLFQCQGFGNREFFQRILRNKSWRIVFLLVCWFREQGFLHPKNPFILRSWRYQVSSLRNPSF